MNSIFACLCFLHLFTINLTTIIPFFYFYCELVLLVFFFCKQVTTSIIKLHVHRYCYLKYGGACVGVFVRGFCGCNFVYACINYLKNMYN